MTSISPSLHGWQPSLCDAKWQERWRDCECFQVRDSDHHGKDSYVFTSLPFTSGAIHIGHVRSYALSDVCARFRRACGDAVLFTLGFDTFGLPSELGAINREQPVAEWVANCIAKMRGQLDRLGFSFDWSRAYATSEPDLYRWSQWVFLVLRDAGLVFRREAFVEWCDSCETVLAESQVLGGRCWRCENPVRLVRKSQWYMSLSAYNEENETRLSELPWNETAIAGQRSLLGRVNGMEFEAHSATGSELTVFTDHPSLIQEGAFIALSPRHPEVDDWMDGEARAILRALMSKGDLEDLSNKRPVFVDTGARLYMPSIKHPLPLVVAPIVDKAYGPTAILGIPRTSRVYEAIAAAIPPQPPMAWSMERKLFQKRPAVRYRASDFSISRQRSWGAPIPMVHCERCGEVPVPLEDLPVELPQALSVVGASKGLEGHADFISCACPSCGEPSRRATETLDGHVDMFLIFLAAAVPPGARAEALIDHPEIQRWLPVAQAIRGSDTGGFLLDERTVLKALRDLGLVEGLADGEPYGATLMHGLVQLDGHKMSKHLDNAVDPDGLVAEFGADAVRFAVLFMASPEKNVNWDPTVLHQSNSFLRRLWRFAEPRLAELEGRGNDVEIDLTSGPRRRLDQWCRTATERMIENYRTVQLQRATRNSMTLLGRIEAFEQKARDDDDGIRPLDAEATAAALMLLIRLLNPICPHLTEELWHLAGCPGLLAEEIWAEVQAALVS